MKKITEKLKKALHKSTHLYICRYCGEHTLQPTPPNACPMCGRMHTDKVTDMDTGVVIGGEPVSGEPRIDEESMELRFFGVDELPELFAEDHIAAMDAYFRGVRYPVMEENRYEQKHTAG